LEKKEQWGSISAQEKWLGGGTNSKVRRKKKKEAIVYQKKKGGMVRAVG